VTPGRGSGGARPGVHLASPEKIKGGRVADVYFNRTVEQLRHVSLRPGAPDGARAHY
jgi:hypothetical protein